MSLNQFFKKTNFKLNKLFPKINIKKNFNINEVKTLKVAEKYDVSFFDSIKYKEDAKKTKAGACITTYKLQNLLPNSVEKIVVKNVLFELANILSKIYSNADIDYPDLTLKTPAQKNLRPPPEPDDSILGVLKIVSLPKLLATTVAKG